MSETTETKTGGAAGYPNPLTEEQLAGFEALATAGTPGPWRIISLYHEATDSACEIVTPIRSSEMSWDQIHANRAYLASMDPQATLAMIAEIRQLRADLMRRHRALEDAGAFMRRICRESRTIPVSDKDREQGRHLIAKHAEFLQGSILRDERGDERTANGKRDREGSGDE